MIAIDTNILVYAELPAEQDARHGKAAHVLALAALAGSILPLQVLGEFLNICRNKKMLAMDAAALRVSLYMATFDTIATRPDDLLDAAALSYRSQLQFFDAVIIAVARRAGATVLLSEDMHNGLVIDGLTILNPFNAANETLLAGLLGSAP